MSIDPTQDPTPAAATEAPSPDLPAAADTAAPTAATAAATADQAAPAVDAATDGDAAAPVAAPPAMSPADCARELAQRFPGLFDGPAKPLKLRIQADIQARAPGVFSRSVLSAFLRRLTGSTAYLNALSRAPARLDLDGQPAGEISEEHRNLALEELARRRALRQERRIAEGGAQPPRPGRGPRPPAAEGTTAEGAPTRPADARPPRGPRPPRDGAPRDGAPRDGGARPPRGEFRGESRGEPRPERRERPPRPEGARAEAPRRDARGPRPEGRPGDRPRQDRRPDARAGQRPDNRADHRADQRPEAAEARIEDPERRARARLLREWESTALTRANFCVLRGVPEAQFDALLEQARAEARGERPAKPRA